jgi:hypothetical protein
VLGILSTPGGSPAQAHDRSRPAFDPPTGVGPGTTVKDPPGPRSVGAGEPAGLRSHWTGTCPVPVQDHYQKYDWNEQAKCGEDWGIHGQLVTLRNDSDITVFVNEWYGADWHGATSIAPHKTTVLPVWGSIFSTTLFIGACHPGSGGPRTCRSGPRNQRANVEVLRWEQVGANSRGLMFVRDENSIGIPARSASTYTALNLGEYPVQIRWSTLGRDKWVDLPPKGQIKDIPGGDAYGRKEFGTGNVGLVQFIPTAREPGADIYDLITREQALPATMTLLDGSWCRVHLQNISSNHLLFHSWHVPYFVSSGGLSLDPGESGTLVIKPPSFLITAIVGLPDPGGRGQVKATNWTRCP